MDKIFQKYGTVSQERPHFIRAQLTNTGFGVQVPIPGSAWGAQVLKRPTFDFCSGCDLRIVRLSPVCQTPCWVCYLLKILSHPPLAPQPPKHSHKVPIPESVTGTDLKQEPSEYM